MCLKYIKVLFVTGAALNAMMEFFQAVVAAGNPGLRYSDLLTVRGKCHKVCVLYKHTYI